MDKICSINPQALISLSVKLIEPNWEYFVRAPLENGLVRFETKTERALYAKVIASEANWMESQTCDRFITYLRARQDLDSFQEGFKAKTNQRFKIRFCLIHKALLVKLPMLMPSVGLVARVVNVR